MPGPGWDDDLPADLMHIQRNCDDLLRRLRVEAQARAVWSVADACTWHRAIFAGCTVPSAAYVGNVRGDVAHRDLVGYEVVVGQRLLDGHFDREGVPSAQVAMQLATLDSQVAAALSALDTALAPGQRPRSVAALQDVVGVIASVHGEWVRIHPFANGNGRVARVWAAALALRYGLPVFVSQGPRPADAAYAHAARLSMGRHPDYVGSHDPATAVFSHLLSLSLFP